MLILCLVIYSFVDLFIYMWEICFTWFHPCLKKNYSSIALVLCFTIYITHFQPFINFCSSMSYNHQYFSLSCHGLLITFHTSYLTVLSRSNHHIGITVYWNQSMAISYHCYISVPYALCNKMSILGHCCWQVILVLSSYILSYRATMWKMMH